MFAMFFRAAIVMSLLVMILSPAGCGIQEAGLRAKRRKENFDDLKSYAQAYMHACDHFQRPPKSWEELQEVGLDRGIRDRFSADGYTVVMGVYIAEMMVGTSNFMLAFPRSAEQEGGQVGFADGHVRVITAEEFKEKLAAQTANMTTAILFEPVPPNIEPGTAGVISVPAGNHPGPPLPPTPPKSNEP
jgi:prepilin-type processing-associated H-X9-DG protein